MIDSPYSLGMVPTDLLIKKAIEAAFEDMRANPFLLDYCFAFFKNDDLTSKEFGDKERNRAKEWFLSTKIAVSMDYRIGDPTFPLVTVSLQNSTEDFATLADINSDVSEEVPASEVSVNPQIILGPFSPKVYDSTTGIVTLPDNLNTDDVFEDMIYTSSANNNGYVIREVIDASNFRIDEDVVDNFTNSYVAPISSFYVTQLESVQFRQVYTIKCFVQNDPLYLLYLNAVTEFALLRYRQTLLEARGFMRSTISSGSFYQFKDTGSDLVFGRDITLTGFVFQTWPKLISSGTNGVQISGINILSNSVTPLNLMDEQGWDTIIE